MGLAFVLNYNTDQVINASYVYIPAMKRKKKTTKTKNLWMPRNTSPLPYVYQKSTSGTGKDAILDLAGSGFRRSGCWIKVRTSFPS